ncbi:tetratricopeptide repeat protein [Pyrococcus yayanosii]|uniref:Tetratricopeptide repeat domain protein n=1 Tax=Pyrococcus yayanosii (strain CH1 / JCM 16557) TaxID=529709 RepID=F8AJG9_PYRYC|nr:tetratricopeptide repeat protein [Pyrococcus yayanosii]AEH25188.1 tetratricopeptide repeat domain protein [Pyrococcus yayanosii CH1]
MKSPLLRLYEERKDIIEDLLRKLRISEECEDGGSFASVRRLPMLTTVIYYLQNCAGYEEGVSLEEIKAFLYCMFLAESDEYEKVVKAITWCPIEQTLNELTGWKIEKTGEGKYIAKSEQIIGKDGKPPYWDVLELPCKLAEKICNDILNPPDEWVRELLSLSSDFLSKSLDMDAYLRRLKFDLLSQRETDKQKELNCKKNRHPKDVRKLVRPEGITVQEFFGDGFSEESLEDLEKAYEEAWEREKLLYVDGYIKLLVSIAEYYLEKSKKKDKKTKRKSKENKRDELVRLLEEIFIIAEGGYEKIAAEYYIKAASIATGVSLIYHPQQDCPEEAERYLRLAVELEEKAIGLGVVPEYHAITLNNLGTHYYETHRPEKALMVLKRALEYAKTPDEKGLVLHNLALTYAELGMKKEAVDCMVKSICIHYSTQHDFGDASFYDDDINRIIEMTGDPNTDIYALKIALDVVSGNLTTEEAKKLLGQIDRDEWPLTDTLLSILNGEECILSSEIVECVKLLQDVAKIVGNENALKLRKSYPKEAKEDLRKLKEYVKIKCGDVPHLTGKRIETCDFESYIKANYGSEECYYLIQSAKALAFSWFTKRRNWRWRIKGIVWINEKPHILLGKVKKQKLWYALYNIDMPEPKIFNLPVSADFTGDLWGLWAERLNEVLAEYGREHDAKIEEIEILEGVG